MQSQHALPPSRGKSLQSHYNTAGFQSTAQLKKKTRESSALRGDVSNITMDKGMLWGGQNNGGLNKNFSSKKGLANQVTVSSLMHITDVRSKQPIQEPPLVKNAQYRLSVRSSVSRANSGKMKQLGSFHDRAEAIVTNPSTGASNYYYQNNQSAPQFDSYQVQVQPRGHSLKQLKDSAFNSAHGSSGMQFYGSSGLSATNTRGSKVQHQMSLQHLATGQAGPNAPARHRSAMQRKGQNSTLQKLLVVAGDPRDLNQVIDYGRDIAPNVNIEEHETRQLLERAQKLKAGHKDYNSNTEMRVILATESQDERVKLVVVEHSFSEVIRAMYKNDQQRNESAKTSPNATVGAQKIMDPDITAQVASEVETNGIGAQKASTTVHRPVGSDSTINLNHGVASTKKVTDSAASAIDPFTVAADKNSLTAGEEQIKAPKEEVKAGTTDGQDRIIEHGRSIKMMDTITFRDEFQPMQWIFTDLMGHIQSKEISQISINEVIKAFLINLNHNKKTDFNNDDLMLFLDKQQIDQKICFAIKGQKRELLDIKDLLDLRKKYPRGIDALQLFKIPTRSFLPFYFHHILAFDKMGRPLRSTLIRLPIKDVQQQMEPAELQAAMTQLKSRSGFVQDRILQVSNDVVARLTEVSPVVLLNIVIVYLLEEEKFEPWFIGTEKCEVLTQKITQKRRAVNKNQIVRLAANSSGPIDTSTDYRNQQSFDLLNTNLPNLDKQNCKSQTLIDAPAQIRIIETDLANMHSGGIKMNRGGRTPSTTTVFQKLDSRSHVTTQKNDGMNEESDRYLMMLNGSETNGKDAYHDKRAGVSMRRQASQDNRINQTAQENALSQSSNSKQSLVRDRKHSRPKTQVLNSNNQRQQNVPAHHQLIQPEISQHLSYQPTDGLSQVFGELGTPHEMYQTNHGRNDNRSGAESTFSKIRQNNANDDDNPQLMTLVEQLNSHQQSRTLSDKEAPFGPNFYKESQTQQQLNENGQMMQQSDLNSSKFVSTMQVVHGTALANGKPDQEALHQILNNNTVIENLREGVLFQAECPTPEENLIVPVVKEFKQRGKSAMIGGRHKTASQRSFMKQHSDLGMKSAAYFGKGDGQRAPSNIQQDQNVYLLQSNELLTENELLSGLARIGKEYGREPAVTTQSITKVANMTKARQLNNGSRAKRCITAVGSRNSSQPRMTNSSRIQAFLNRQEQLKAVQQETKAQRLLPKALDNRIMNLFPQFLDKSASRQHSKFLFGDSEQLNVFRNFRNAMQSQETKVKNLVECMLPQDVIRNEMKLFGVTRDNQYGTKVFDFKTSDYDEQQFIEQIIGGQSRADENSSRIANESRPFTPQGGNFGEQNQDLASLSMNGTNRVETLANSTITVGYQQAKNVQSNLQSHSDEPDLATSTHTKGRDFLAETLLESRKAIQKYNVHTVFNQMDKNAMTMMEAQKKLDGVVINDPERVIEDFRNTKLYKPAPGPGDYNLIGRVPKVNSELATKYVEMKETIRQQKALQEAQYRMLNNSYQQQNYRTTGGSKPRSTKNRAATGHSNQQMMPHQQQQMLSSRRRVQQSARQMNNPRIQLNMIEQNKKRESTANALQDIVVLENETDGIGNVGIEGLSAQQEMVIDAQLRASEHPQSIDTIDQVHSMHRQSIETYGPLGFKCSMSLCCDNLKIAHSLAIQDQAMHAEDICYIQQNELLKTRQYLVDENVFANKDEKRLEQTITRYLRQFQLLSPHSDTHRPMTFIQNADLQTSSILLQEPASANGSAYLGTEVVLKQDITQESNDSSSLNLQTAMVATEQLQNPMSVPPSVVQLKQTRYEVLTQRVIQEVGQSSLSQQQASMLGIEVVKRVAVAVLADCYGVAIDNQVTVDKSPAVNSKTKAAAQSILKPIEDLSVKTPQIFKHERLQRPSKNIMIDHQSFGKSTLEVSKGGSPDVAVSVSIPHKRQMSELVKPFGQQDGANSAIQPAELQQSQLVIRHVKLDQENWVPSPELVPCCVRCFSIATYVLNYELGHEELADQTGVQ